MKRHKRHNTRKTFTFDDYDGQALECEYTGKDDEFLSEGMSISSRFTRMDRDEVTRFHKWLGERLRENSKD